MGCCIYNRTHCSTRIFRRSYIHSSSIQLSEFEKQHRNTSFSIASSTWASADGWNCLLAFKRTYTRNKVLCSRLKWIFLFKISKQNFDFKRCKLKSFFIPSGWGKNDFANTGAYQAIMKEVDVPIVDTNNCQTQLRTTRLGSSFVLDSTSFMCAGGEAGKGKKLY